MRDSRGSLRAASLSRSAMSLGAFVRAEEEEAGVGRRAKSWPWMSEGISSLKGTLVECQQFEGSLPLRQTHCEIIVNDATGGLLLFS